MNILTHQTLDKGNTPKDILMIRKLIENEGIEEYEKNTLNFLAEFLNTYTLDILSESKQYSHISDRAKINIEDVKLAVKLKQQNMFSRKPDLSTLNHMAREVNNVLLPNIPDSPHLLLPASEYTLTRNNFQVFSEDLFQNLNNPTVEIDNNKFDELEINSLNNKSKSRQTIIGIKRHNDRNVDRISINSNFKKRRNENDENFENTNIRMNYSNQNKPKEIINQAKSNNINYNTNNFENQKSINQNRNHNTKDEDKSENQDFNNDEYNNDEGEADDYDNMEHQSDDSGHNFGMREEPFDSNMGDDYM